MQHPARRKAPAYKVVGLASRKAIRANTVFAILAAAVASSFLFMSSRLTEPGDELREEVVRYLALREYWGTEKSIRQRMKRDFPAFDVVDYSSSSFEEFDQSLIHLPNALEYMRQRKERYAEVSDDVFRVVRLGCAYCSDRKLMAAIFDAIEQTFRSWTRIFKGGTEIARSAGGDVEFSAWLGHEPPMDAFLDALLASEIQVGPESLFTRIFPSWMDDTSSVESSANVLDLFLRIRCQPSWSVFYRDPTVLNYAFDTPLIEKHWKIARRLIQDKCSPVYQKALKQVLLDG